MTDIKVSRRGEQIFLTSLDSLAEGDVVELVDRKGTRNSEPVQAVCGGDYSTTQKTFLNRSQFYKGVIVDTAVERSELSVDKNGRVVIGKEAVRYQRGFHFQRSEAYRIFDAQLKAVGVREE